MPECAPSILIYGLDSTLLQTRQWVLEASGYKARTATHWSQFVSIPDQPPVSLLILCHSLDEESCSQAMELAEARWPGIKLLVLGRNLLKAASGSFMPAMLSLDGPLKLIANVDTLIGRPSQTMQKQA